MDLDGSSRGAPKGSRRTASVRLLPRPPYPRRRLRSEWFRSGLLARGSSGRSAFPPGRSDPSSGLISGTHHHHLQRRGRAGISPASLGPELSLDGPAEAHPRPARRCNIMRKRDAASQTDFGRVSRRRLLALTLPFVYQSETLESHNANRSRFRCRLVGLGPCLLTRRSTVPVRSSAACVPRF